MVWVIAFGELFFGDLWCVVWGYGGMRTHFSLLNPIVPRCRSCIPKLRDVQIRAHMEASPSRIASICALIRRTH